MKTIHNSPIFRLFAIVLVSSLVMNCSTQTRQERLQSTIVELQSDTTRIGQTIRQNVADQQTQVGIFMLYAFAHPIYTSQFLSESMMESALLKSVLTNDGRSEEFENAAQMAMVAIGLNVLFGDDHAETAAEAREREETYQNLSKLANAISDEQQAIDHDQIEYNKKTADLIQAQHELAIIN